MGSSLRLYRPAVQAVNRARFQSRLSSLSPEQVNRLFNGEGLIFSTAQWYDAAVNAIAALCNSGFMEVYTGTQPSLNAALTGTKLAKLTFGATAFGASSGGTATANAIGTVAALATGTAGYFALMKSDDTTVVMTGSVGTSGADLNFNTLSITSGINVSCSSFTITG
jgi:hypothetical protein